MEEESWFLSTDIMVMKSYSSDIPESEHLSFESQATKEKEAKPDWLVTIMQICSL